MHIKLSNGRLFKLSWQHTDASDAFLSMLEKSDRRKESVMVQNHFNSLLDVHFREQEAYYFARIHGATECFLLEVNAHNEPINAFSGIAWCSAKDVFSKETGRKRSLADALDVAKLDRNLREEVWKQYFDRK